MAVTIEFPVGESEIPSGDESKLDQIVAELDADPNRRLQLLAYASPNGESASRARRLSLSRALAVRSYLMGQGVRSTRMDVRALGDQRDGGPADRVDIEVTSR